MEKNTKSNKRKAISIEALKNMNDKGILIDIRHPFDDKQTIAIRVRRIDMTKEVIGNEALNSFLKLGLVEEMQEGKKTEGEVQKELETMLQENHKEGNIETTEKLFGMIDHVVKLALVEPTYEDFVKTNTLTLSVKTDVFNWVTEEMKQLQSFRKGQ